MKRILISTILLLCIAAFCCERETIRDAHGKVVGTATTDGNTTVYRDAHGKVTGTSCRPVFLLRLGAGLEPLSAGYIR